MAWPADEIGALEYAKSGIRINAVCPGFIRTATVERVIDGDAISEESIVAAEPMARIGQPEEIANAVFFLCSDDASCVADSRCRWTVATSRNKWTPQFGIEINHYPRVARTTTIWASVRQCRAYRNRTLYPSCDERQPLIPAKLMLPMVMS